MFKYVGNIGYDQGTYMIFYEQFLVQFSVMYYADFIDVATPRVVGFSFPFLGVKPSFFQKKIKNSDICTSIS